MSKQKKENLYRSFLNNLNYDFNIYTESELLELYIKKKLPTTSFIYNEIPDYLIVENININIIKNLNNYKHSKKINERGKTQDIEPILIKNPPILEDYYKIKKIMFKKKKKHEISITEKLNIYTKLEKSKIFNIRLNSLNEDNFNSFS